MFCNQTNIDYQSHSEYQSLQTSRTLRQLALSVFDKEFTLQLNQERKRSSSEITSKFDLNSIDSKKLSELNKAGIVRFSMSMKVRRYLNQLLKPRVIELEKKRSSSKAEYLGVETASLQLGRKKKDETDIFHLLDEELRGSGILDIASAYLKRKMSLKFANLQINEGTDCGIQKYSTFPNGTVSDCYYMHIDSAVRNLKLIVYLNDVEKSCGAFRYIPGSQHWMSPLEKCIRRANDRAGLEALDPKSMTLFYNLPPDFRMKANFGNDLIGKYAELGKSLVNAECAFNGREGDMLMFDNSGIHRGAIFEKAGQRKIIQIVLS